MARRDDVTYADDVTSEQPLRSPQSALRLYSFFVLFYFIAPRQKIVFVIEIAQNCDYGLLLTPENEEQVSYEQAIVFSRHLLP